MKFASYVIQVFVMKIFVVLVCCFVRGVVFGIVAQNEGDGKFVQKNTFLIRTYFLENSCGLHQCRFCCDLVGDRYVGSVMVSCIIYGDDADFPIR